MSRITAVAIMLGGGALVLACLVTMRQAGSTEANRASLVSAKVRPSPDARLQMANFRIQNEVSGCFDLSITSLDTDSIAHEFVYNLKIEVKRKFPASKDLGETVRNFRYDCCPKYTFPYLLLKDSRGKNYGDTLLTRPDKIGEIADTIVEATKLTQDGQSQPPYKLEVTCR